MQNSLAAGDDAVKRQQLHREVSHVGQAHSLYSSDVEQRQILEARLLTSETFDEIAERFAADAQTIDYYERLFFNVRDRMDAPDWLITIIRGTTEDRAPSRDGVMTSAQRGFVYRLFAYFGGPLVLDTLIGCLSPHRTPHQDKDASAFFDDATAEIVRSRAAMAASVFVIDRHNVMQTLKLALRTKPAGSAETAPIQLRPADYETIFEELERLLGPVAAKTASA
jgi:hypothetical protein